MRPFRRSFAVSKWDGSFIPKATLLVHAEQGLGDTLNFVRFIPRVSSRVGRVIFECQRPLVRLLKNVKGIDQIIAYSDALPNFDFHVPLLSLPGIFKTTPENVPEPLPYINEIQESCELISEAGDEIKVGIVWTGNPANPVNRFRTIGLSALKELFSVRGCLFFSLQCGESADKILDEGLEDRICDLRPLMDDFAATANLIKQLDVVISVCTSVAHLGGSIGSETWIMLPMDADWRWLRGRRT